MISLTRYVISTGEIRGYSQVGTEQEVIGNVFMLPPDHAFIDGHWEPETHYVLDDVATERPILNLPETYELLTETDWVIPNVPVGAVVEIDDAEAGTTDETGLTLSFATPGVWPVKLRPPFPWIEASCEVTVT